MFDWKRETTAAKYCQCMKLSRSTGTLVWNAMVRPLHYNVHTYVLMCKYVCMGCFDVIKLMHVNSLRMHINCMCLNCIGASVLLN